MPAIGADFYVYFGTQDPSPGTGFSLAHFDTVTGVLTKPLLIEKADAPSYFTIHPDGKHLYTTHFSGAGGISAYEINPKTGALTRINRISGNGAATTFIGLDNTARTALVANFRGGHLASYRLRPDGGLGEPVSDFLHPETNPYPQHAVKTYPHSFFTDLTNHFAFAPDKGLDKMYLYAFDEKTGALTPNTQPFIDSKPGAGPRHVRFHPNGKWVYLINELDSTIVGYIWDAARGTLSQFQSVSTLPEGFKGDNAAAELEIHPNGKFLYGSNRGNDTIVTYAIDPTTGKMTLVGFTPTQGKNPRNFALDPTAQWMIVTNQVGNSAVVFKVDPATGKLTQVGEPVEIAAPCCERFLPVSP
jgi:6-phosphogluconolactonase